MNLNELTRFERARIIGARALQIALGAPILVAVEPGETIDPVPIAARELDTGIIPVTVHRPREPTPPSQKAFA